MKNQEKQIQVINVQNQNGVLVTSSVEVAENFGKRHSDVLKQIEGSKDREGLIQGLIDSATNVVKYFIQSEYKDSTGKMNKEYLLTRDGFSLLVMGFTGKKALEFKLKYIDEFNKMEEALKNQINVIQDSYMIEDPIERAKRWIEEAEEKKELQQQNEVLKIENKSLVTDIIKWADAPIINALVRKYGASLGGTRFGEAWNTWKSRMLYKYGIGINQRIAIYEEKSKKKTKPATLSFLYTKEELTMALKTALAMCKENDVDVYDILGKHVGEIEID